MTTQQFASEFLPSMSDCRRGFDRVELGIEIALGIGALALLAVLLSGI
jgi:hypothetical protein